MGKIKAIVSPNEVKYLCGNLDPMWDIEASKLRPWTYGKGADIGCGLRSPREGSIRVDIDENVKPDVLAFGDNLPFKNKELDFITSVHSFEHFKDQEKLLIEWLRVLKVGGIIGIVHPDVRFTKGLQNPDFAGTNKFNPLNTHYHENTEDTLIENIENLGIKNIQIIDHGVACPNWSFYLIIKKTKE